MSPIPLATYSRATLPSDPQTWPAYRKVPVTRAVRLEGPFAVETSEGLLTCEGGYLAMDSRGYPYPIATEEFRQIYTPAGPPEGPGADPPRATGALETDPEARLRWWFRYHPPSPYQQQAYAELREAALVFARAVVALAPPSADRSDAIHKIREAVMTANAAIACEGR